MSKNVNWSPRQIKLNELITRTRRIGHQKQDKSYFATASRYFSYWYDAHNFTMEDIEAKLLELGHKGK